MEKRTVHILGSEWTILFGTESQFPNLNGNDGYTDSSIRCIVIDEMKDSEGDIAVKKDMDEYKKQVLRHEIIHAFMFESGLDCCSNSHNHWSMNEEMIDWIAIQLPKIIDACREALAI